MKSPIALKMQYTWLESLAAIERAPGISMPDLVATMGQPYNTIRARLRTLEMHRLIEDAREPGDRNPRFRLTSDGERTLATLRAVRA